MTHAQQVVAAITEAEQIAHANPVLFARMAHAGRSISDLSNAYDLWLGGHSTAFFFMAEQRTKHTDKNGNPVTWTRERKLRRARGKRQRGARKVQQAKARTGR